VAFHHISSHLIAHNLQSLYNGECSSPFATSHSNSSQQQQRHQRPALVRHDVPGIATMQAGDTLAFCGRRLSSFQPERPTYLTKRGLGVPCVVYGPAHHQRWQLQCIIYKKRRRRRRRRKFSGNGQLRYTFKRLVTGIAMDGVRVTEGLVLTALLYSSFTCIFLTSRKDMREFC